jgi:hypothetical protein
MKGSNYTGVYKCKKTNMFYAKNFRNKVCYKSPLFKKETDAARKYDQFVLKYNPRSTKINFPKKIKFLRTKISEYIKVIIYSRQNDKCTLCNDCLGVGRTVDHIIPLFLGGLNNIHNFQAICGTCNKWKTYRFDHFIKNYLKKNKKISLKKILEIQREEFNKFNGEYPIRSY